MAMDLSDYLQNEAKKRHAKKSDIAFRTGISESYIYKIFTGTKHTKQRDYVIAICRAMNMNVVETQIALTLNGMDVLNPKKPRDWTIMTCINWQYGVHKTNSILGELKFKELKVRCDI